MMKIGKLEGGTFALIAEVPSSLTILFEKQKEYQKMITGVEVPSDDVHWYSYHIQAMVEEMGELLKSDKRWKTHRNTAYDGENKLEELSDMLITLMNITMYSGFTAEQLANKTDEKIKENTEKYLKGKENEGGNKV